MHKWLLLALFILLTDQLSKYWVLHLLGHGQAIAVTPFFNLVLVYNTGAAFGLFANAGGWQWYVFTTLALIAAVAMVILLRKHQDEKKLACAASLILGGAIGNVIDRFVHGHVIDFADFYYQHYHWPAFNVADSALCLGAALLIIDSFSGKKR